MTSPRITASIEEVIIKLNFLLSDRWVKFWADILQLEEIGLLC